MPVSSAGLVVLVVAALLLMRWMATDGDGFLGPLDAVNLVIHEFGHLAFALFGKWPMYWGGTLMELIVPAVCAGVFIRQRSALSAAVCGIWFFENFNYIATYVADARVMELPLAGGGEHDWNIMLSHYGLLQQNETIASRLEFIAYAGIVVTVLSAIAVWIDQRGRAEAQRQAAARLQPDVAAEGDERPPAPPVT